MAEVTDRDRLLAAGDAQAAQRIAAYRESCVAEERAARLKAEGERDELSMLHAALVTIKSEQDRDVADLEARLRAVIEVADRLLTTLEPRFTPGDERQRDAIVAYRRIRDAQPPASPEPDPSIRGCPTLLSLAPDYAPQALKEMEADRG